MAYEQFQIGKKYTKNEILEIKGASYIPTDHCYNRYCKGGAWKNEKPGTSVLFEYIQNIKDGKTTIYFKYLGSNANYTGEVIDYRKENKGEIFGYWENGIFTKNIGNKIIENKYTWVPFFEELWNKICTDYNKESLYPVWHELFPDRYNFVDADELVPLTKIDPLSFIGKIISLGNDELTNKCNFLKTKFELSSAVPIDYKGIPRLNRTNCLFIHEYWENRKEKDDLKYLDYVLDILWDFAKDLNLKGKNNLDFNFKNIETILKFKRIGISKLSQLIFLIKPNIYYACDDRMVSFLFSEINDNKNINEFIKIQKLAKLSKKKPYELSYEAYLYCENRQRFFKYMNEIKDKIHSYLPFLKTQLFKEQFEREIYKFTKQKLYKIVTNNELDDLLNKLKPLDNWNRYNIGFGNGIPYAILNKHYRKFINGAEIPMESEENKDNNRMQKLNIPLNQILYGPPGTGKTYNTVLKAMSIIDDTEYKDVPNEKYTELKNRFDELKQAGQIEFVTFHQSYSYEEFVEGIKPNFENETLSYKLDDGIFKQICDHAKQVKTTTIKREPVDFANTKVFKMSLGNTLEKEDDIYNYCIENNVVSLGWKNFDFSSCKSSQNFKEHDDTWGATALERFVKWMDIGDIIIISNGNRNFRAIAQVKSDYIYDPNTPISHTHFRKVDWLYVGEDIHYSKINDKLFSQQSIYGYFYTAKKGQPDYNPDLKTDELNKIITGEINKEISKPHVLIIDEINRGDVSKIFGELITLIEEDKRIGNKYQMTTTLPYSKKEFGVPNNLYIIGTMNTADRSIALLDTALRRRFDFEEIMPKPELLNGEIINGINLEQLLKRINERITEKYDRDHQLGHSYLMNVENEKDLERAYKNRILPLLNEYFYNDSKTVSEVLNCDEKELQNNYLEVLNKAQN